VKAQVVRGASNIDAVEDLDGSIALLVKDTSNPDWGGDPPVVQVANEDSESVPTKHIAPSAPTIINQTITDADEWIQITGIPSELVQLWYLRTRTKMSTLRYAYEESPSTFMTIPPGWTIERKTDISSTGLWIMASKDNTEVELETWTH